MNHGPWEACDTRADHDVPWFSAALDFSISILNISCLVTCTPVVLLSNVRETSHVVWHACRRAKRIILSLSLSLYPSPSLSLSLCSICFSQNIFFLPESLSPFLPHTRGKQDGATRHTGPFSVRVKCVYNVVHASPLIALHAGQFRCLALSDRTLVADID